MKFKSVNPVSEPDQIFYKRCTIDLQKGTKELKDIPCRNLEDVLGGFGRSFQDLETREVENAYSPLNPLIVNTGILTGSKVMTGLRTYFSGFSPIKGSLKGLPAAMWSTGSGKFGAKLKWTGVDEIFFENRSENPVYVVIKETLSGPEIEIKSGEALLGLTTHEKIMHLSKKYEDAHFAVIGQGGENWENVRMGSVALSTVNQLKSKEDKCRFAGRGGMGSLMGYKNVLAIVAQSKDKTGKLPKEIKEVNSQIAKGDGTIRLRPLSRGGGGGTWSGYDGLQTFHAVPYNNFRPTGNDLPEKLFRSNVENKFHVQSQACFRCGIACHNNVSYKNEDGSKGEFIAKFDYEPLNLLGTNIGIHNAEQAALLIQLADNYGMDSISLGATISYVLSYNERHPEEPLLNGAQFGDFKKIKELIIQTGNGENPEVGQGSMRLSQDTGETSYAYHVKGLELPAYLPDTNPGYMWAVAGGHMSMATYGLLAREGKSDLDSWVEAVTDTKLHIVGFDMIGLCKFFDIANGIGTETVCRCLKSEFDLNVTPDAIKTATRRAFIRALALEFKQGYTKEEFSLPPETLEAPNSNVTLPNVTQPEFIAELQDRVWDVFDPELEKVSCQ